MDDVVLFPPSNLILTLFKQLLLTVIDFLQYESLAVMLCLPDVNNYHVIFHNVPDVVYMNLSE